MRLGGRPEGQDPPASPAASQTPKWLERGLATGCWAARAGGAGKVFPFIFTASFPRKPVVSPGDHAQLPAGLQLGARVQQRVPSVRGASGPGLGDRQQSAGQPQPEPGDGVSSHGRAAPRAQGPWLGLRHRGRLGPYLCPGQCHQGPPELVPGAGAKYPARGPWPRLLLRRPHAPRRKDGARFGGSRLSHSCAEVCTVRAMSPWWTLEGTWPQGCGHFTGTG
ncbi:uncharacterized protein LOC111526381 [Piliocolobus tephrosceles]|uniref:uncharacterized protein LOC111526381 n=1 Tax=Piliocolobus tephrosceles TaxID=591936 RepID=UPI000E6B05F4|nr:uncharacterized protein LOC111526381 [Piliocolobus tephrosceles]